MAVLQIMPDDLLQLVIMPDSMRFRYRVIIMDGKHYVEGFVTNEELAMADDQRAMQQAFMDGLCVRWKNTFGTDIEVIDNGPHIEWTVRYKDDATEVSDQQVDG